MDEVDYERAIRRAELVVKVNEGKEAIAEEVNLARAFLTMDRFLTMSYAPEKQ